MTAIHEQAAISAALVKRITALERAASRSSPATTATAWTPLTFQSAPWRNYGPGGYQPAEHRMIGDRVSARGLIDSNGAAVAVGAAEWIGRFPVGFRPPANHVTTGHCYSSGQGYHVARIILQTGGLIVIDSAVTTGAVTYLALDFEFSTIA